MAWLSLATAAVVAAGCGAEAPEPDVLAATSSTEAAGTARTEIVTRITLSRSGETDEIRSHAIVDYANRRREDIDAATGCRTITIGEVSYSEVPGVDDLGTGKRWVRVEGDAGDAGDAEEAFEESQNATAAADGPTATIHFFFSAPQPAPDEYLEYVRKVAEAKPVGREEVDGVSTIRYRGAVDVREQTRHQLEADGWQPANVERYLDTLAEQTEEVDVWVDDAGVARRVQRHIRASEGEPELRTETVVVERFFDFGVQAEIEPPPASEVMSQDEWLQAAQAQQEEGLRESLDEGVAEEDDAVPPLPGSFVPPVFSDAGEPPPSCLH